MSPAGLSPLRARSIVEARLGREPQDMLEAAVALEAWAGIPAGDALSTAAAMMHAAEPKSKPSAGQLPRRARQRGIGVEALSFAVAVIAIACWAAPLSRSVGAGVVERALICALPTTLALQWGLASRYLSRPHGLAQLGRRPLGLLLAALLVTGLPAAALGLSGVLAGLLALTWTGGTIAVRRGWSLAYAGLVVAASVAMVAGLPAMWVLGAAALVTTVAVAVAVRAPRAPGAPVVQPPGRWSRALAAAALGAGLGALLVVDRSVDWSLGTMPAVALLPSSLASFWGGQHLWRFQVVIPQTLSGVAVLGDDARRLAAAPVRILVGAVARLVLLTAALSVLLLVLASALAVHVSGQSVLVGFGLVALATMFVSLLESIGRAAWAIAGVGAGVAAEIAAPPEVTTMAGGGLILGASIAVLVMAPMAFAVLGRPATTLATSIGIR